MTPTPLSIAEAGTGRSVLVLHGGGGPFTVTPIAAHLAESMHTLTPVHPGWNGTERPESLRTVADLAAAYLVYLAENELTDVLVIGSSLGGWIGSEMLVHDTAGCITALVLIDAAGVEVEGEPMRDFFTLDARGVAEYSFHDSEKFYRDPATIPAEQAAAQRANMVTMQSYGGYDLKDAALLGRLGETDVPVLVLWGESDRIVTPAYGAAFAAGFRNSRFAVVPEAGHLPQLEQPAATFAAIDEFVTAGR